MGAPLGNKNNSIWTLEKTIDFCQQVYEFVLTNDDCSSLTKALTSLGGYDELLCYLEKKHKNEFDFQPIKEAKDIVKARLIEKGLYNKVNPTMAIFILKNNHDMADKIEQKQDLNVNSVNLKDLVKFGD